MGMCQSLPPALPLLTLPPPGTCLILSLEPQRDVMWLKSSFLCTIWTYRQTDRQTCRHDRHTDRTEQAGVRGRQTWPRDKQTDGKEERKKERKKNKTVQWKEQISQVTLIGNSSTYGRDFVIKFHLGLMGWMAFISETPLSLSLISIMRLWRNIQDLFRLSLYMQLFLISIGLI